MRDVETRQLSLAAASLVGWERCFSASVWGTRIGVCVTLAADGRGEVMARLTVKVFGHSYAIEETFNGNQCFEIPIVTGVAVKLCALSWSVGEHSVTFTLKLAVTLLGYSITLYQGQITLPIPVVEEIEQLTATPVSGPQELAHLLALLGSVERGGTGAADAGASAQPCGCGGTAEPADTPAREPCVGASPYAGSCWFPGGSQPVIMTCRRCCAEGGESWARQAERVECR
jgi:hypothetical protein